MYETDPTVRNFALNNGHHMTCAEDGDNFLYYYDYDLFVTTSQMVTTILII